MADYKYIHIALRGETNGQTRTLYSYNPTTPDGSTPGWDKKMVEPAAAIKRFLNATECYVLQSDSLGHYFSLITRPTFAPERGYVMISLLVDEGCALSGRQLIDIFANLRKAFLEDETITDEAVEQALTDANVTLEPVKLEAWKCQCSSSTATRAEAAYRTYITIQELESIFSFPCQPEYADYRCIIVVSATTSLRPGIKMPRLTNPIRKLYSVVCPDGVSVQQKQVYDGDRLEITYSREGFNTHTESVVVGAPSAFTKYDGSTISIRTSQQVGLLFKRVIPVTVLSTKGSPILGYTITVNERNIASNEPVIDFFERDLIPGGNVEIEVSSNNYQPLHLSKSAEEIVRADELTFELKPVVMPVTLHLDFGDGRVFDLSLEIEKNTPEYNRLHSGNFHGFRAHRQVTSDGKQEVYNVDVRHDTPPTAPNFDSNAPHDTAAKKAPQFENVSDEAKKKHRKLFDAALPKKRKETPEELPDTDLDTDFDENDDPDFDELDTKPWYKRRSVLWAACAVIVAVVLLCIFFPEKTLTEETAPDALQVEALEAGEEAPGASPVALSDADKADVEYLNSYPVWEVDKLSGNLGKQLVEAITAGDIDAIASNDYFAVEGLCTNTRAAKMADLAWAAKGSPTERVNRRVLKNAVANGQIDLVNLVNTLATRRPGEGANTQPRPKK